MRSLRSDLHRLDTLAFHRRAHCGTLLFHFVFDAFCYRWKLYGMEHDRPLLLKISVNPTPHGTMPRRRGAGPA